MNQEIKRMPQNGGQPVDVPYISRHLWKNIFVILMSACIIGMAAFVGLDHYMGSSYTATMNLAMIARDNTGTRLSDGSTLFRYIHVTGNYDLKTPGQYSLEYVVTDTDGNTSVPQILTLIVK